MSDARTMAYLFLGLLFVVFVLSVGISRLAPSSAEKERRLQKEIASCQARGGEPHLYRDGEGFYVRECWIRKE